MAGQGHQGPNGWSSQTFPPEYSVPANQGQYQGNTGQPGYNPGGYSPNVQGPGYGPPTQYNPNNQGGYPSSAPYPYPPSGPSYPQSDPPYTQSGHPHVQSLSNSQQSHFPYSPQPVAPPYQPPGGQQYQPPDGQQYPPPGGQQYPPPGQQQYQPPGGQPSQPPGGQQYPPPGQQQYQPPGGQPSQPPGGQQYQSPGQQQYQPPGGQPPQSPGQQPPQSTGQAPPANMSGHTVNPAVSDSRPSNSGEEDMEVDENLYGHGDGARMKIQGQENHHGIGSTPTGSQHHRDVGPTAEAVDYYPDRFLLSGLTSRIREETLSDYVEVCSGYEVEKIEYSLDMSKAVVTLAMGTGRSKPDWSTIKSSIAKRHLEGSRIQFQRQRTTNKICVWHSHRDVPHLPLRYYFEHAKSGNEAKSAVIAVERKDEFSVVTFESYSAVGGVLAHKPHTVSGLTFDVTAFYDDLGPVKQVTPQTREETFRFRSQGEGLLMRRLVESLETEFNLQEVTVKDLEVRLKGDHSALSSAMEKLHSTRRDIKQRDVTCSNLKAEYLNSQAGRKEMIAVLDRKDILASWKCHTRSITIYGLGNRDVSVTESIFEKDLKEANFDDCPNFDELNDHLEKYFDKNKFRLCRKAQCFLAQKDIFSDMKIEIENFLEQSKPKETQHVLFSPEEHKFLHIVMREHMSKFRRDLQKDHDVEIRDSGMKLSVYGHQKDIRHVCEALEGFLKDNMKRDQLHLDSKESERFQKVTNGNSLTLLKHIEDTRKCIIKMEQKTVSVTTEDENLGAVGGSYGSEKGSYGATGGSYGATGGSYGATGGSYGADRDGHYYRKQNDETGNNWQTKKRSGRKHRKFVNDASSGNSKKTCLKITVVEGEIAKTDADVSVNVTTSTLDLEFGAVSKSFKKEGGPAFVKECKSYKHYIPVADFIQTAGGKLKCKHVLHCNLPLRSVSSCEKKYKEVVRSMLKEVDQPLHCKSIALPALGTGAFHKFDASWVAKTLYEVVSDFDKEEQPKHLKEVKFVVYSGNQDVVKAFRDMDKTWKAKHEDKTGSSTKIPGSSSIFPKVTVVSGELAEQKTEVIVNTSNSTLDLSKGAVSKSILDKAGPGIQSECYKWRSSKGSIHPGHFAVTNAGNMKDTKKLYHCHLPYYKHDTIKLLEDMLVDMLESAEQHHTKDIAFPALGTGVLKYPTREVARAFFQAVTTFQLNRKSSSLKEIRLVVYGADSYVLQTFKEEENIFLEKSAPSANSTPTEPPAPDYDDRENSESSPGESGPLKTVQVGPFTVSVKHGDISKQRNTCIVNPINSNMSLKTGSVSKALGRVGGKEFEDKTKQVDYILREARVAFVNLHKDTGVIHLDRQYLEKSTVQAIMSCLKLSKTQKFDSISFPILLTGDAAQKMATDLYQALLTLDSMASVTAVNVSVVIYDKSQADTFCRKFASLNKGGNTEMRREETQIVFHLCSDTTRRLEYTKGALKGYAEDGRIVERINRPAGVTEDQISRVSRDYDDVNVKRNHGELELKGKPADVLKLLTALMQLFDKNTYENDDSPDENALFGDGQSGKYGQKNPKKYSFTESAEANSWSIEKYTDKDTNKIGASHTDKNYGQGQDNSEKFSLPSSNYGSMEKGTVGGTLTSYQGKKDKYSDNEEGDASFRNNDRTGSEDIDAGDAAAAPYKMVWSFLDPDGEDLNPYDKEISRKIEMAYRKGEMLFSLPLDVEGSEYVIDFKMMVEYPMSDSDDVVPVLRREEGPEESSSIPNLTSTSSLKTSDGPYQRVKEHIKETRQDLPIFLVKIEKIENKEVYERFQWKKKTMKEGLYGATERLLWHRCVSTDSIVPINKHGMNLHFCRPAYGGPLGEGIELCEHFTDILQHDTDRNQHAYLCNVLVGDSTKGQSGLRDPPSRVADESSFFHSVVDKVDAPSRYLVFSDAQIEPQYLVTFKLETSSGGK